MDNKKKSNVGKWLPWVICGVSLLLLFSPIDIIPDLASGVVAAGVPVPIGHIDDIAYVGTSIVSFIVGIANLFKKR